MNPDAEQEIRILFHQARELPAEQQSRFIAERCGHDHALRGRIEALLACDQREVTFLDRPLLDEQGKATLTGSSDQRPLPDKLGRYRVIREIGRGSMGTVFEAELESPRRTVAVKVLRPGSSTTPMLRRFQFEVDVLRRLQHPYIARFYDSGTTDSGFGPQPFFAMEYVEGRPLHDYADEHALPTRERLELLAKICDAAQHAHTRGIIHRDLKPGNILVDASGRPKVLDFGVARAVHGNLGTSMDQTTSGQLIGTLRYMSPEQAQGDPGEVDTRCDIYTLGAIGYELLGGRAPFDLDRMAIPEAVRTLADLEPPRLGGIRRELRGDIETIIAMALEKIGRASCRERV